MEYWEFLIQKEGERSWQPIKSPKMELEAGRYRVVAHSSRKNTDVEICVTYTSTEEVPPKRRSQKRSRRTNPDGLMVVTPFTQLKPGLWELQCCGDILSDFLGNSWQESVQLQVLPDIPEVLPVDDPTSSVIEVTYTDIQTDGSEIPSNAEPNPVVVVASTEDEIENGRGEDGENGKFNPEPLPSLVHSIPEIPNPEFQETEQEAGGKGAGSRGNAPHQEPCSEAKHGSQFPTPLSGLHSGGEKEAEVQGAGGWGENSSLELPAPLLPASSSPAPLHLVEPAESNGELVASTTNSDEGARTANPLLDESLQTLEQILQQVLEPVLQDFERSESPELDAETVESEEPSEIESDRHGLTLSLDEDTFVARRGEPLTITGRLALLDGVATSNGWNERFEGRLRYELRDPQTSIVLFDVQHPLPEQALSLAFSHTLELPSDCNTRLMLGKVTLYGATSTALAYQPFTVTADLDELLGAIIPGSKAMPVAKMLVLANSPEALQNVEDEASEATGISIDRTLLNLVNVPQTPPPLSLKPTSQQPLPPQLYQPAPTEKSSKSLHLPNFSKMQPVTGSVASSLGLDVSQWVEVKPEESTDISEDTQQEAGQQEDAFEEHTILVEDVASNLWDSTEWSDSSVSVVESRLDAISSEIATPVENVTYQETPTLPATCDASESTTDLSGDTANETSTLAVPTTTEEQPLSESEVRDVLGETKEERQPAEVQVNGSDADDSIALDSAFQALNLQDRFWGRLNSLVSDAESSEWLKSEVPSDSPLTGIEEVPSPPEFDSGIVEVEDISQSLDSEIELADFDESLWEESEAFNDESGETDLLEPPLLDGGTFLEEQIPTQPQGMTTREWLEEIVVDDEEPTAQQQHIVNNEASGTVYPTQQLSFQPEPRIPSSPGWELPLPTPTIFIPANELAAGEPVTIRIKLPPQPPRLCVKLWIQDRQSRSLLDGPRWLVDLIPDGAGQMEAMTQLIVPFGSVEIRFEAIAVDIYTQRESHKVTVDCVVVPPDLPNISLDDFED